MSRLTFRTLATFTLLAVLGATYGLGPQAVTDRVHQVLATVSGVLSDATATNNQASPTPNNPTSPAPKGHSPISHYPGSATHVRATTCHLTLSLADELSNHTLDLMRQAAREFNSTSPMRVTVTRQQGFIPVDIVDHQGRKLATATKVTTSNNEVRPISMSIDPLLLTKSDALQISTYMHEMAHLFGLAHSSEPGTLMYPKVTGVTRLTKYEVKALRKVAKGCA